MFDCCMTFIGWPNHLSHGRSPNGKKLASKAKRTPGKNLMAGLRKCWDLTAKTLTMNQIVGPDSKCKFCA